MAIFKLLFVVFVGGFVRSVMSAFNPMLTYTMRFHKISLQPNIFGNLTVDQYRNTQFVNGNIKINSKEIIDNVIAMIYRCDPEGINCEYFQTWELTDICYKLKEKNQVWSRWYGSFDPPMVCPLDKINYTLKNATMEIGRLVGLYSEVTDYQWRVVQKLYSGEILVGSYSVWASLFGYRKKKKSILNL